MKVHMRRWGAVHILLILFIASWAAQAWASMSDIEERGWAFFWAATFENWQSEWLQLVFQAILLMGAKHWLFQADARDLERIEGKLDTLLGEVSPSPDRLR